MTSKEALNQLYIMADTPELAMNIQSYYNIVEKDLEVLEILKKRFCFGLIEKSWAYLLTIVDTEDLEERDGIDCTAMTCLNVQDSKIIKEWLENE